MRIEYFKSRANGNVIRLFDFINCEVKAVQQSVDKLTTGTISSMSLKENVKVNPFSNCRLTFQVGKVDKGISYLQKQKEFLCVLTKSSFENISQLLASFALHPVEQEGYHWLDETSDISLLISPSNRW